MIDRAFIRVGKNAAALVLTQVAATLLAVLFGGFLARTVGAEGLGRYLQAMTVKAIALAIANLGLNVLTTRELARLSSPQETNAFLGNVLVLKLASTCLAIAAIHRIVMPIILPVQLHPAVATVSWALVPEAVNGSFASVARSRQRMETSSGIELAVHLLTALAGSACLLRGGTEHEVLGIHVAALFFGTALYCIVLWRWNVRPRPLEWPRRSRAILEQAVPFLVGDSVAILYRRLDLMLLGSWHGDAAAGIYGAAYRLWETMGLLPSALLDALFPELARRAANRDQTAALISLFDRATNGLLTLALVIMTTGLFVAPTILPLVYGKLGAPGPVVSLFRILILGLPLLSGYLLSGHLLISTGQQAKVTQGLVVATAINAIANLCLIPRWSYWGAAMAALLAELALFVTLIARARPILSSLRASQNSIQRKGLDS